MAIPQQDQRNRSDIEPRAKVRTGEKRTSNRTGAEYPAATDYFLSDDLFHSTVGAKPAEIVIAPVTDNPDDFWGSGMEWWLAKNGQNVLACFTKDGGSDPIAHRITPYMDEDDTVRGPVHGSNRTPITCRFRQCPHFMEKNGCKPMGRLVFNLIDGVNEVVGVYQYDTKAWNSIENIEKFLAGRTLSPDDRFKLSVAFQHQGDKKFVVVSIEEVNMDVNTPADVDKAEALVALMESNEPAREALAAYLTATQPDWRENTRLIARLREIGAEAAVEKIISDNA